MASTASIWLVILAALVALEQRASRIARQGWEFYAVTAALFVTLAFPGFTGRYLFKHRPA